VAEALATKGPSLSEIGRFEEGVGVLHGAIALADSHGLVSTRLRASYNLAGRLYSDDPSAAFRVLREALELSRRLGQRGWFNVLAAFNLGAAVDAGEWDWGMALADEVFQGDVPPNDRLSNTVWQAQILAMRGRDQEAQALLDTVEPILADITNDDEHGIFLWSRSTVAFARGDYEAALAAGSRAVEVNPGNVEISSGLVASAATMLGDPARLGKAIAAIEAVNKRGRFVNTTLDEFRAAQLAFDGRREEAQRLYADVRRRYHGFNVPTPAAFTTIEQVAVMGADDPEVAAAADEARAFLTRVGAQALLQRLDEALAHDPFAATAPTPATAPRAAAGDRVATSPQQA
jgi:tetratricopeptide (TPR) repeat protein